MEMVVRTLALCVIKLLLASTTVHAADIVIRPDSNRQPPTIYVTGQLLPGDGLKFETIATSVKATDVLDSPGGDVVSGLLIGQLIAI
jgi:hypothetical protein